MVIEDKLSHDKNITAAQLTPEVAIVVTDSVVVETVELF